MKGSYDDIINCPRHSSPGRPKMSMIDRAAQFSPFAALTGYGAAVTETARLTDSRVELDEDEKAILDGKLRAFSVGSNRPEVQIIYFLPDEKKAGGAYVCVRGRIRQIEPAWGLVRMEDGTEIPLEDVAGVEGPL